MTAAERVLAECATYAVYAPDCEAAASARPLYCGVRVDAPAHPLHGFFLVLDVRALVWN